MKTKLTTMLPGLVVAAVAAFALLAVTPQVAHAAAKPDTKKSQSSSTKKSTMSDKKSTTQKPQTSKKAAAVPASYTYTAQPGDSYTLFARKAIETYVQANKINLSQSRIIYAETNLTVAAGSPYLNLGQQETLSTATVKQWVTGAQNLSAAEAALWDVYVPTVNFDVSHVGQAS